MTLLSLKYLHILSMILLFGTGLGSAFYKWSADRSGNILHIANTNRHVVLADWLFTTPTVIIQPLSGLWMAHLLGIPFSTPWLIASLVLYTIAGVCWLPVVWLQIKMHNISKNAAAHQTELPAQYWHYAHSWFYLGIPAFTTMLLIVYLMIFKSIPEVLL
ncbi:FIG00538223: hypothetical protein [hydrothermal vent metagenome]|uniref:Integral membrane protein n=1 Tax=hydrothermal vent metagenome TaxID=652676 RepID=A0A3B0XQ65_9ZZZZ